MHLNKHLGHKEGFVVGCPVIGNIPLKGIWGMYKIVFSTPSLKIAVGFADGFVRANVIATCHQRTAKYLQMLWLAGAHGALQNLYGLLHVCQPVSNRRKMYDHRPCNVVAQRFDKVGKLHIDNGRLDIQREHFVVAQQMLRRNILYRNLSGIVVQQHFCLVQQFKPVVNGFGTQAQNFFFLPQVLHF